MAIHPGRPTLCVRENPVGERGITDGGGSAQSQTQADAFLTVSRRHRRGGVAALEPFSRSRTSTTSTSLPPPT
jgi:hypothetical protein